MSNRKMFEEALAAEGVTGQLAAVSRSIYMQESGGGANTKTSNQNATGGMQIIPGTFASVADKGWDINDPLQNARAGIRYLKQLDKQSGGRPELTAAGYYGGPGGMEKARRGISVSDPKNPKAPNTLEYGQQVVARMGLGGQSKPMASPVRAPVSVATAAATVPPIMDTAIPAGLVAQQVAANPVPEQMAAAPMQEPMAAPGPDPWSAFTAQFRNPVQPSDLAYGQQQPAAQYVPPALRIPDFASMASYMPVDNSPDFRGFMSRRSG